MSYERLVKNFFTDWLAFIGGLTKTIFSVVSIALVGLSTFTMNCRYICELYKIKCN